MKQEKLKEKSKVLEGLNKQQEKAVTFGKGPLLIIAGAGTGKTTVLTRRIVWLLEQGLAKPEEILALTFTEKASTEMEDRVDLLMPLGYSEISISTFHAFCQKILQQHAIDIGLPGDFKLLTRTESWKLVKQHIHDFDLDYYKPVGNPSKFIHALLDHFKKVKGEEISPEEYLSYAESLRLDNDTPDNDANEETKRVREVAGAYHKYQKLLLDNSFLDFEDLIIYTIKLFRKRPKILSYYQNQFKYILVDEFQDTDLSQYELVRMISKPEDNITVVGDDDQSIYKFRGASISNILKFKEDYPKAAEVTLTQNYRSSQQILDLAYGFIQQNNPERLESKLKISKKLKAGKKMDSEIEVLHGQTLFEEAKIVADKIISLKEAEKLGFNDFAILVRANDHAEPFLTELGRRGLPFIFVANRGLYKKTIILDILAYLNLLDNYHEAQNFYRVLNFPKFMLEEFDLVNFLQSAKRKSFSLFEAANVARSLVKMSEQSYLKLKNLLDLIQKHTNLARERPITELLVRCLEDLGVIKEIAQDSIENVEKRSLLEQFYKKCQKFESEQNDKLLKNFLNQLNLEIEAGDQGDLAFNPDLGPEAIKVMTVHSAKGLEFSCVFCVNLVDQRFPTRERSDLIEIPENLVKEILPEGDAHLMEERRLFYVAMTRAKRFLYLAYADDYGGTTAKKPSRFLVELGLAAKPEKSRPVGQVFFASPQTLPRLKTKLTPPDTFSFSQVNCFLNCPLEYKYLHVYKLPMPGKGHLSFGDTIHKTLEKFLNSYRQLNSSKQPDLFGTKKTGIGVPRKELLSKYYEECWVDDWYEDKIQKQNYRKQGIKMLDNFYEKFSENPKPVKFLEQRFKLKIGNYKFVGKIDRADENSDSSIDIIDYKTGQIKEKLSPEDKTQLLIYQWAAEEEFKIKVHSLKYWYLASLRDSIEFLGSKEEVSSVKEKILLTIEEIVKAVEQNSFNELDKKKSHNCQYRNLERE